MAASGVGAYESGGNLDALVAAVLKNLDSVTVLNVSAVTTTQTSTNQANANARGAYIIANVTTLTGTTPTLTPKIQGTGPVSNQPVQLLLATTAISATGVYVYYIYPYTVPALTGTGITQAAGFSLPKTWNVVMTAGGTITNATYTVEASYVL